jgi:hypothetical protein
MTFRSIVAVPAFVLLLLLLPRFSQANPPLANPTFEIVGPNGSLTVNVTVVPGPAGLSAANSWSVFHNTAGTTTTRLLSTTLGTSLGVRMIEVATDGPLNGIVQTTGVVGSGPLNCIVSGWVFVISGVVGLGGGNGGATQATSIVSTTSGVWEYLQVENLDSPCNEILFYSIGGAAEFFVDDAGLKELQEPGDLPNVEYSNFLDERAIVGGGSHAGLDPGQILYTEPPDTLADTNPQDVIDFFPLIESGAEPDAQIDALASGCDAYFDEVVADQERLLVSFLSDPGPVVNVAVYHEDPSGATGIEYDQRDVNFPNLPGDLEDLDALELWRIKDTMSLDDSTFFSTQGDTGGVSIYQFLTGVPVSYITQAQIYTAISTGLTYEGLQAEVDVDALMVRDLREAGIWDQGDEVLFSIRSAGGWTGVEIVHWKFGSFPTFLVHGGHVWDTTFVPSSVFPVADNDREVDAIEAPEPSSALGLLFGAAALLGCDRLRQRKKRGVTPDCAACGDRLRVMRRR